MSGVRSRVRLAAPPRMGRGWRRPGSRKQMSVPPRTRWGRSRPRSSAPLRTEWGKSRPQSRKRLAPPVRTERKRSRQRSRERITVPPRMGRGRSRRRSRERPAAPLSAGRRRRSRDGELLALLLAATEGEDQWERIVDNIIKEEEHQNEVIASKKEEHKLWHKKVSRSAIKGLKSKC